MGRTEKRPTARWRKGMRVLGKAGAWASLISLTIYGLLLVASYARGAAVVAGLLSLLAGTWEWFRGRDRMRREEYRPLRNGVERELGLARAQIAAGSALIAIALLLPPALVVGLGLASSILLLLLSAATSGPLSEEEERRELLKSTAALECELIARWAEIARRVRTVPGFGWIPDAAHSEGPHEHVSVLRTVSMWILSCACALYLVTGVALGVSTVAPPLPKLKLPGPIGGILNVPELPGIGRENEPEPTYADLCPEIPDPLDIGHQLGPLFRRDGAIKAGCGTDPVRIPESGTWAAPGMCDGELRSLAVSAPGHKPAIVYGSPARFAWAAAQAGTLVALETASPNDGDVYLVVTSEGSYGFARPTRSLEEEEEEARSCSEVGGRARSFARLEPGMVGLWLELMRHRAEWSWPKPRSGDPEAVVFADSLDAAVVATGRCGGSEVCSLVVEKKTWPWEGSGYVSLSELAPYMPD